MDSNIFEKNQDDMEEKSLYSDFLTVEGASQGEENLDDDDPKKPGSYQD